MARKQQNTGRDAMNKKEFKINNSTDFSMDFENCS